MFAASPASAQSGPRYVYDGSLSATKHVAKGVFHPDNADGSESFTVYDTWADSRSAGVKFKVEGGQWRDCRNTGGNGTHKTCTYRYAENQKLEWFAYVIDQDGPQPYVESVRANDWT
ncbi:hypothetical protein VV02_24475 [Luteipulveratus mongoliensis]|uniref:Uncharacterized protein n=2 Tax=Luteipulveratus mongoliensis TaxID=571913 RepID=A0A0K1JNJ1_9MICO|nr:hypothetical protein VV02_24475 [Luteipulveratus mongoliensis]